MLTQAAPTYRISKIKISIEVAVNPHRYHPFKGCYLL
jgi:hypothetical protein